MQNGLEQPVRLELVARASRVWLYVLFGALLGAVFEIVVALPLNIIFRAVFEYLSSGKPLRLQYFLTHPLRPGEWPAISLSGLILGAVVGWFYSRVREEQQRLQGLKEEFEIQVAAMRHHYKNLSLGISGFSDRARRKLENLQGQISELPDFVDDTELEALRRSVLNLLAASQSLSTALTEELILLKALQSCEQPSEPQDFLAILRHVTADLLQLRFQNKHVEVNINGKPIETADASLVFTFEPHTMEIVLHNLLGNAMRVANTIQIRTAISPGLAKIEITDDGPGLELDKIRKNLIRSDKKLDAESTQLGLRVTLYLLDKCGGKLYAASRPGSGATFIMEFRQSGY